MHPRHRIKFFWAAGIAGAFIGLIFFNNIVPTVHRHISKPDKEDIWEYVEKKAGQRDIDPHFVYAIIFAESSFDPLAEASNGYARGLMQLSEVAWETVDNSSWSDAYDWEDNIDAGTAYLAHLKKQLQADGHFSYPLLAASYRYGIGKVQEANYDISGVPSPENHTYQQLFAGDTDPVAPPQ